jgi:hypothetical protein
LHQHTHHLLINGKAHPISDCAHWRLDPTGPSCAKGFDLEQHPCAGCELYAARADDPLGRSKPRTELAAMSTRIDFSTAAKSSPVTQDYPETPTGAPRPGVLSQAVAWLKAEASALVAKVPDEQYEARLAACRSCPELEPLPAPQVGHCKACGCGRRARAELTIKGRMPGAKCPKKLWE